MAEDCTKSGYGYNGWYIHDQESYGALWLRYKGELNNTKIYASFLGGDRLTSQAGIRKFDPYFKEDKEHNGYIYLRYFDVADRKVSPSQKWEEVMMEYKNILLGASKIYANGGSEVWKQK